MSDDCPEDSVKDKPSTASSDLIKMKLSKRSKSGADKKVQPVEEKSDSEDDEDVLLTREEEQSRKVSEEK